MSGFQPVRDACEFTGGITALAKCLGLSPQVIHNWAAGKRPEPKLALHVQIRFAGDAGNTIRKFQISIAEA